MPHETPNPELSIGDLYEELDALGVQMASAKDSRDFERMDALASEMKEKYGQIVEKNDPNPVSLESKEQETTNIADAA